jgi:hypothetical protein
METMKIEDQYIAAQAEASKLLASLRIADGPPRKILGLDGWIFEQTIRCAIDEELKKEKIQREIKQQQPIVGKAKVDLVIGHRAAIEVKVSGFYSNVEDKYIKYKKKLEDQGLEYFYVTLYEEYQPNIEIARRIFGLNRMFILSNPGEWEHFSKELVGLLKK